RSKAQPQVAGEPGAYLRELGAQGRGHPGCGANPSQGTITHTHSHTTDNLEMPAYSGLGEETEVPRGNSLKHKENMNSMHTGWRQTPSPGGVRQTFQCVPLIWLNMFHK
ncbi:hypothetical protein AMELA_G00158760, partial [Ameiurus melas]